MKKVLIGNRGEIAVRASQACRDIGLPFVVIYTDQDCMSEHVIQAKESFCLGSNAKEYLNGDRLLEVCKETGATLLTMHIMCYSQCVWGTIDIYRKINHVRRCRCCVSRLWLPV